MTDLRPQDFGTYMADVYGHQPFPWQERLLEKVLSQGTWPSILDLPTGTGKTAVIDIALFHLALEAGRPDRRAPTRAVVVVDRRTIVDQTYRRAQLAQKALRQAETPILQAMRNRLALVARSRDPLGVAVLRGGIARDDAWAESPDQPLIAVSTVDQVGSRLLFRGYGVSAGMAPIHAGLLGNDTVLFLDEVHLSRPFCETLTALQKYRRWADEQLPDRWQVVRMSATVNPEEEGVRFGLEADDHEHAILRKRLEAKKPATLVAVPVRGDPERRRESFVQACVQAVTPLLGPGRTAAVVVNRVQTAREIHQLLGKEGLDADVELVTGRMRPLDREQLERRIVGRVAAGRTREDAGRPLVLVATQCIEAGADFDFDVLVTECASLDALRQRFGRLNRLGEVSWCQGVILMRSDAVDANDPIYGKAMAATWSYLSGLEGIDFGLKSLTTPDTEVLSPVAHAPVLLPAHLDSWVQTSPPPEPEPDVALWLHGPDRGEPEVQIVWRADLSESLLQRRDLEAALARIEVCPPTSNEALSVPLRSARDWLALGEAMGDFGDAEGAETETTQIRNGRPSSKERLAVAWRGGDESEIVDGRKIRPGDTLIVPSGYGGLTAANWDPAPGTPPVVDLGDLASLRRRGRAVVRLNENVLQGVLGTPGGQALPSWAVPPKPGDPDDPDTDEMREVRDWLDRAVVHTDEIPAWMGATLELLQKEIDQRRACRIVALRGSDPGDEYLVVLGHRRVQPETIGIGEDGFSSAPELTSEEDLPSLLGVEVSLREHLEGVRETVDAYGRRCGLPEVVLSDLIAAAEWHDAGKADPRFQQMLHGGSAFKCAVAAEPLAKSGMAAGDREQRRQAQLRSGYPAKCRHEVQTVAILEAAKPMLDDRIRDLDLVQHLVASHHGRCRPFAPVVADPKPVLVVFSDGTRTVEARSDHGLDRLDSGIADRFWVSVRRYGWFGLAWLETMLRLADHRRSAEEQRLEARP